MSKYNWDENFRGDGSRGHCPDCNQMFNVNHGQTFKTALLRHYEINHKEKLLKAIAYTDALYAEIQEDLNRDNK